MYRYTDILPIYIYTFISIYIYTYVFIFDKMKYEKIYGQTTLWSNLSTTIWNNCLKDDWVWWTEDEEMGNIFNQYTVTHMRMYTIKLSNWSIFVELFTRVVSNVLKTLRGSFFMNTCGCFLSHLQIPTKFTEFSRKGHKRTQILGKGQKDTTQSPPDSRLKKGHIWAKVSCKRTIWQHWCWAGQWNPGASDLLLYQH